MGAKTGDGVKVVLSDYSILEGRLMPSKGEFTVLKLGSGYNIGVKKNNIKSVSLVETKQEKKEQFEKIKQDTSLPKVSILHTGGTVASKVDYETGGVSAHFTPEEILNLFPELKDVANISSRLLRNIMSESIRYYHYNLFAKAVKDEIEKGANAVIITHGTDTMHCTSAALAFALQNVPIPVLIVGAQRSSDRPSSDAAINLISSIHFAINSGFKGVAICMHENMNDDNCLILPGLKVRKMHSSRRDAFKAINTLPIARINYKDRKIEFLGKKNEKIEGDFELKLFKEDLKVGLLKTHINMFASEFEAFKGFDGLVIEGTGLGQIPDVKFDDVTSEHEKIYDVLKELTRKMPVVMATQTIYGRVNMNVYSEGRKNIEAGVLGNLHDMTPETAFIKLAWLLSNYDADEVKAFIGMNMLGEISARSE